MHTFIWKCYQSIILRWDTSLPISDLFKGFLKGKKIQSHGYKTIYNLAKDVSADELSNHKVIAAMLLKSMAKSNFFFGKNFDYEKVKSYKANENAVFFGSLILRLSKVAKLNTHQVNIFTFFTFK